MSRLLSAGGGLLMAASFFMPMVNVFGPESPLSGSTYVIQNIDAAADVSFLLLIVLPHLFGVLIVLGALLGRAARPLAGIRAGVRVHLILWFCAHAFTLWRAWMSGGENEYEAAVVYSVLSVGVVALGVPWLPRSRSSWTDARFVCRGQQVGALLSLLWFGQWAVTNRIFYGLPVAMLAAASMLAGGFLRGRAEPLPSERP